MRKLLLLFAVMMLLAPQGQADMQPVFDNSPEPQKDYGILYFNSEKRRDVSIMSSFISECNKLNVTCICADVSGRDKEELKESFNEHENCLYSADKSDESPRAEFYADGKAAGNVNEHDNFALMVPAYLRFVAKEIDKAGLSEELKAVDETDMYKKIIPRMNFVLMLAKKGERDAALKELDSIDKSQLEDRGLLLLGETYIRLKAPERSYEILKDCVDKECRFYAALSLCLSGKHLEAIEAFEDLKKVYNDDNKINFYIKAAYKALGDDVNADKIKLPDNYNINSD